MNAQKSLSSISANRDLWIAQYHQELHERDRMSGLAAARREGLADGVRMTARNLLALGTSIATIANATGLSEDEIGKLR